jgi:hypothetical protein
MPFALNTREEALVACGRHCCICHRFVGTKIECHHIQTEAEGGDDSLSNCIPLCFDCHADVQHYNPQHPKGTKYRISELRSHRDRWIERVSNATPAIFDEERRSVDRELFATIKLEIPESLARGQLKDQCWGQPFSGDVLVQFRRIDRFLESIESEFIDPTCEGYRAEFFLAFRKFWLGDDFLQVSPVDHTANLYRLPKEWTRSSNSKVRQQFNDHMNNLNKQSSEAFDAYETMIREVRRLLIVR